MLIILIKTVLHLGTIDFVPNILRVIISRRLRWAGHVARIKDGRSSFTILSGKPRGKIPLGEQY